MLRFEKDKYGLKLIVNKDSPEAANAYRAMLQKAGVPFAEGFNELPTPQTYFKVETPYVDAVKKMVTAWATAFDDIAYAMPLN